MVEGSITNENVTVSIGMLWLIDTVFKALELNTFLDSLKRNQGVRFSTVVKALVAFGAQSRGLSVLNLNEIASDPLRMSLYGLPPDTTMNDLYRAIDRLAENRYAIQRHILAVLKRKFHITLKEVYVDWSASYIDGKATLNVRFGHSKDHRPDRPQVSYGIAIDAATGIPVALTVERGNINDNPHFRRTFGLISRYMPKGARIVFDAGANSRINKDLLVSRGLHFLTRSEINSSDMRYLNLYRQGWVYLLDGTFAFRFKGNLGYTKTLYYSEKRRNESLEGYRRKAIRDYDNMLEMMKAIESDRPPQKRFRNSNYFVDTELRPKPEFIGLSREEAIGLAVKKRITGKEGFFILLSSFDEDEQITLDRYRRRNVSEDHYLDLKTGIRIRPLRAKKWTALRGRVLIAYLGLFAICFARHLTKAIRNQTAETIIDEVHQLSVMVVRENGVEKGRFLSNFNDVIQAIDEAFRVFPATFEGSEHPSKGAYARKKPN